MERYRLNNLSEQTITTIKKAITSILNIVGKERIEDLTIEDIDKYKRYRVEHKRIMKDCRELEYSAGVTRRRLGYLKTILKRIGKKELADQIELPRAPDDQDDYVWLTRDEFKKLRDATAYPRGYTSNTATTGRACTRANTDTAGGRTASTSISG